MTSTQQTKTVPAWWTEGHRESAERVVAEHGLLVAAITRDSWRRTADRAVAGLIPDMGDPALAVAAAEVWEAVVR